jgi:hypothetical protein
LARAKNTDRAVARRRYREQARVEAPVDELETSTAATVAQAPPATMSESLRGAFRLPNIREDIRILPEMFRTRKLLWLPFLAIVVAFFLGVALANNAIPAGLDRIVALYVELTLPPTALFVFFIGGFLAPRASYLVGALLGFVDGILWSLLFVVSPTAEPTATGRVVTPTDFFTILVLAIVVGALAAGFASWYRNFLRQSQERARQNRLAREQQARAKAKEDERKAREEQRRTAATGRPSKSATPAPAAKPPAGKTAVTASSSASAPAAPSSSSTPGTTASAKR